MNIEITLRLIVISGRVCNEDNVWFERTYYTALYRDEERRLETWKKVYKHGVVTSSYYESDETGHYRYIDNAVTSW